MNLIKRIAFVSMVLSIFCFASCTQNEPKDTTISAEDFTTNLNNGVYDGNYNVTEIDSSSLSYVTFYGGDKSITIKNPKNKYTASRTSIISSDTKKVTTTTTNTINIWDLTNSTDEQITTLKTWIEANDSSTFTINGKILTDEETYSNPKPSSKTFDEVFDKIKDGTFTEDSVEYTISNSSIQLSEDSNTIRFEYDLYGASSSISGSAHYSTTYTKQ